MAIDIKQTYNDVIDYLKKAASRIIYYFANLLPSNVKISMYTSEIDNRSRVVKLLEYYRGHMLRYLDWIIDTTYNDQREAIQLKKRKGVQNIVQYVCDNVANVFKNGITVEANEQTDQDIYDYIVDTNHFDIMLKEIEKLVFLIKTVFVKVTWDETDQEIKLYIVTPEKVEVKTDENDYTKMDRFTYSLNDITNIYDKGVLNLGPVNPQEKLRFASWTDDSYIVVDAQGKIMYDESNSANVNPYGVIPFVQFRDQYQFDCNYVQWPGDDLEKAQDNINLYKTELNYLFSMQSFSTPVLINPSDNMYDRKTGQITVPIGPGKPIVFRATKDDTAVPPSFSYVSPDAKFVDLQDAVNKEFQNILYMYGVNVNELVPTAERSSGAALQAGQRLLEERRQNKRLLYINTLSDLFKVIKTVWNTHNTYQIKDDVKIEILDAPVYKDPKDQIVEWDWKLANNLITLPEILMETEDDIDSKEQAQEIIDSNVETNAMYQLLISNAHLVDNSLTASSVT